MHTHQGAWIQWDTEYTSWEGAHARNWTGPGELREIVQIAAIRIQDGHEVDQFMRLVKPVKNPVLSEYFTNLTGITQDSVDMLGVSLEEALEDFRRWAGELPVYAFGRDYDVVKANAELVGLSWNFRDSNFFDIRNEFQKAGVSTVGYQSSTILRAFGEEPFGRAHDALDDVRNVVAAWRKLPLPT